MSNRLFHSVKRAHALKTIPVLINLGVNPHETDEKGRTLLHYAAEQGNTKLLDYLLHTVNLNPNVADCDGQTAMHIAATQRRVSVIKTLHSAGGDVNASDKLGLRPLHIAAIYGHITCAATLVDKGADIFATTYSNRSRGSLTAKETALLANRPKIAEVLCSLEQKAMQKMTSQEPVKVCKHSEQSLTQERENHLTR